VKQRSFADGADCGKPAINLNKPSDERAASRQDTLSRDR
jgi:hypothetical protein